MCISERLLIHIFMLLSVRDRVHMSVHRHAVRAIPCDGHAEQGFHQMSVNMSTQTAILMSTHTSVHMSIQGPHMSGVSPQACLHAWRTHIFETIGSINICEYI